MRVPRVCVCVCVRAHTLGQRLHLGVAGGKSGDHQGLSVSGGVPRGWALGMWPRSRLQELMAEGEGCEQADGWNPQ